jgi:hypothetical protein
MHMARHMRKNTISDFFGRGVFQLVGKAPNPSTLQILCRLRILQTLGSFAFYPLYK